MGDLLSMIQRELLRRCLRQCRSVPRLAPVQSFQQQRPQGESLPQVCLLQSVRHASFKSMDANEQKKIVHAPPMEVEKDIGIALKGIHDIYRKGNFTEALDQSMSLKDYVEKEMGEDHPVVASLYNNIALFHKMLGRLDDAALWYSQALHKYKQIVGEKHRSYAATLNNLGLVYLTQAQQAHKLQAMGLLDSAEQTLRRVLDIRTEILEDDDPALATSRTSLASVLQRKGKPQEAEELLRTALSKVTSRRGRNNEAAATAMNNLAFLLKGMGRLHEALDLYLEALTVRKDLFGDAHPDVVIAKNNLAELYRVAGREDEALVLQREILAVLEGNEGSAKGN